MSKQKSLPGRPAFALAFATLASCANVPMERVAVEGARLAPASTLPALACAHRLAAVTDAREPGAVAGNLGRHAFVFPDATAVVRQRLLDAGLRDAPAASPVSIELRQLYVTENLGTRVPVVVYRVAIAGQAPRIIRAQAPSMNWNGNEDDAYRALSRALDDADRQLFDALNETCRSKG